MAVASCRSTMGLVTCDHSSPIITTSTVRSRHPIPVMLDVAFSLHKATAAARELAAEKK